VLEVRESYSDCHLHTSLSSLAVVFASSSFNVAQQSQWPHRWKKLMTMNNRQRSSDARGEVVSHLEQMQESIHTLRHEVKRLIRLHQQVERQYVCTSDANDGTTQQQEWMQRHALHPETRTPTRGLQRAVRIDKQEDDVAELLLRSQNIERALLQRSSGVKPHMALSDKTDCYSTDP
jgi:hypothetical protein